MAAETEQAGHPPDQNRPIARHINGVYANGMPLALGIILILAATGLAGSLYLMGEQYVERSAVSDAQRYSEVLASFRSLYTTEVVQRARAAGTEITHDYHDKPGALPLPATLTLELGQRLTAARTGVKVRLYSDHPFPWRQATSQLDAFEAAALSALRRNPTEPYFVFERDGGPRVLRYASADLMQQACVDCHNSYPGSPKTDWQVGDVRGALEVVMPVPGIVETAPSFMAVSTLAAMITTFGFVGMAWVVRRLRADAISLSAQASALSDEVIERRRAEAAAEMRAVQLKNSNKELEQFAYVASHDLQEPLRKIQAFGERLETRYSSQLDAQGLDFLNRMRSAASRMSVLINDVLTFSRVASRAQPMQRIQLDVVMQGVLSDLDVAIEVAKAEIQVSALPELEADPVQMRQLFQNLIGNALKFRKPDEPARIETTSRIIAADLARGLDARCEIVMTDHGIGFEQEYVDRIFDVFQRLHAAGKFPGSGIGLAICRKIVERHQGKITAKGMPGVGAIFTIELPLRQRVEATNDEQP